MWGLPDFPFSACLGLIGHENVMRITSIKLVKNRWGLPDFPRVDCLGYHTIVKKVANENMMRIGENSHRGILDNGCVGSRTFPSQSV